MQQPQNQSSSLSATTAATFRRLFNTEPLLVRSPGRVNIIGEHTDYNNGFVLPAAIDKAIYIAMGKREDDDLYFYSEEFSEEYKGKLSDLKPTEQQWPNYVLGVIDQLQQRGHQLTGLNVVLNGDVPIGAGLSSSAAVECASIFALNQLFNLSIDKVDLVKMAQKAEHEFAGVKVGIMDMFASMFGKKDHLLRLDCQSLEYEYVPLKLEGYKLVLFNTNVKHSLASTEYNTRRQECEKGVAMVKEAGHPVNSLRDVTIEMLDKHVAPVDALIYKRCKYVVEENMRLLAACDDLVGGNIKGLGEKMFRTHDGLSKEYEVSCEELDFLVNFVRNNPAVLGARMMGGGFGGCTINVVKEEMIDTLVAEASEAYPQAMDKELTHYIVQIEDGTSVIEGA